MNKDEIKIPHGNVRRTFRTHPMEKIAFDSGYREGYFDAVTEQSKISSNPLLTDVKPLKDFLLALRFAEDERIRNEAQKMLGLYFC